MLGKRLEMVTYVIIFLILKESLHGSRYLKKKHPEDQLRQNMTGILSQKPTTGLWINGSNLKLLLTGSGTWFPISFSLPRINPNYHCLKNPVLLRVVFIEFPSPHFSLKNILWGRWEKKQQLAQGHAMSFMARQGFLNPDLASLKSSIVAITPHWLSKIYNSVDFKMQKIGPHS